MSNRTIAILLVILIGLIGAWFFPNAVTPKEDVKVVYVPVTYTPEPTPTPIYIVQTPSTNNVEVTPEVIVITPVPTVVPTQAPTVEPTPIPTAVPTQAPTVEPTPIPTAVPTLVPTAVPTQVPTIEPTPVPTAIPIPIIVTPVPTWEPVMITIAPTQVPTVAPTQDMTWLYEQIESEVSTITRSGDIYLDYTSSPYYDLYNYITVYNLDSRELFTILRKPFENGIAKWVDMQFVDYLNSTDKLEYALNSSICPSCGRVIKREGVEKENAILRLFAEIDSNGDYARANQMLLDFLYFNTIKNPNNPTERLLLVCNE